MNTKSVTSRGLEPQVPTSRECPGKEDSGQLGNRTVEKPNILPKRMSKTREELQNIWRLMGCLH